jgi:hypothetical protein
VAAQPARLVEAAVEAGRQEVERLVEGVEESIRAEVGELADSVSPDRIPGLEWMRDWRPER